MSEDLDAEIQYLRRSIVRDRIGAAVLAPLFFYTVWGAMHTPGIDAANPGVWALLQLMAIGGLLHCADQDQTELHELKRRRAMLLRLHRLTGNLGCGKHTSHKLRCSPTKLIPPGSPMQKVSAH